MSRSPSKTSRTGGPIAVATLAVLLLLVAGPGRQAQADPAWPCPSGPRRECVNAGQPCPPGSTSCSCQSLTVSGGRLACWCIEFPLPPNPVEEDDCLVVVEWETDNDSTNMFMNETVTFTLVEDARNRIEIGDAADLTPGLFFSTVIVILSDVPGTFTLDFGSGPPEAIPVRVVDVDITLPSVPFGTGGTGPNRVSEGLFTSAAVGRYDSTTGEVWFENGVPTLLENEVLPSPRSFWLFPILRSTGPGDFRFVPMASVYDLQAALCPADVNADGVVDVLDLLRLLGTWGSYAPCPPHLPEDTNQDCTVDVLDLLELLTSWGPCS